MKKNRGSIFLTTVFIVFFVILCLGFITFHLRIGALGMQSKIDSIQSDYCAESVVNSFLGEDNLENLLKDLHRKKNKINLPVHITMEEMTAAELNLFNFRGDYGRATAVSSCVYRGIRSRKTLIFQYIHDAYLQSDGVLDSTDLRQNQLEEFRNELTLPYYNDYSNGKIIQLNGDFHLGYVGNKLCFYEEQQVETDGELKVEKIVREPYVAKSFVQLHSGSLVVDSRLFVDGMFDINGSFTVNDSKVNGILVLRENAFVDGNGRWEGYIINLYDRNNPFSVILARQQFDLYLDILPKFITVKVQSIEKNKS